MMRERKKKNALAHVCVGETHPTWIAWLLINNEPAHPARLQFLITQGEERSESLDR